MAMTKAAMPKRKGGTFVKMRAPSPPGAGDHKRAAIQWAHVPALLQEFGNAVRVVCVVADAPQDKARIQHSRAAVSRHGAMNADFLQLVPTNGTHFVSFSKTPVRHGGPFAQRH